MVGRPDIDEKNRIIQSRAHFISLLKEKGPVENEIAASMTILKSNNVFRV
jgi:hypothetical protein